MNAVLTLITFIWAVPIAGWALSEASIWLGNRRIEAEVSTLDDELATLLGGGAA